MIGLKAVVEIWQFIDFPKWRPSAILDLPHAYWDHPQRVLSGLYCCAKSGWNQCSSFDNILCIWLENACSHTQNRGFGGFDPLSGQNYRHRPKKTHPSGETRAITYRSLDRSTCFYTLHRFSQAQPLYPGVMMVMVLGWWCSSDDCIDNCLLWCRSEGFLCLPKHFSHDVGRAIDRVCNGEFRLLCTAQPFYSHRTCQHQLRTKGFCWSKVLVAKPLLIAARAFRLGRRC